MWELLYVLISGDGWSQVVSGRSEGVGGWDWKGEGVEICREKSIKLYIIQNTTLFCYFVYKRFEVCS